MTSGGWFPLHSLPVMSTQGAPGSHAVGGCRAGSLGFKAQHCPDSLSLVPFVGQRQAGVRSPSAGLRGDCAGPGVCP